MKTTLKVLDTATAGALLTFTGCTTSSRAPRAWEYQVVEGWAQQPELAEFEQHINEAGGQGLRDCIDQNIARERQQPS